jgi:hypothetical protein
MADSVQRPFVDGDEKAVNEAFNRVFSQSRELAEWRWKFPATPFGRFIMLTVGGGGEIRAHYGAVPVRVQAGDLVVTSGQIADVFSVADAKGGLAAARTFQRTLDAFIDTFCKPDVLALCYGFPSARHLKLGVLHSPYAQMPPQPVTVFRRPVALRGRWLSGHRVREGFAREAVDELWERAGRRHAIAAVRDGAWLERRFTGRPGVEYLHLSAWRRGRVAAWAVLRLGAPVTSWAELVWDGEDARALAALDRAAASAARGVGAERLEMWLDGDAQAASVLARLGWQAGPHPLIKRVVHCFHPAIDPAGVPGRLYVTMSDGDLV